MSSGSSPSSSCGARQQGEEKRKRKNRRKKKKEIRGKTGSALLQIHSITRCFSRKHILSFESALCLPFFCCKNINLGLLEPVGGCDMLAAGLAVPPGQTRPLPDANVLDLRLIARSGLSPLHAGLSPEEEEKKE
jgi:hypothetical protein